MAKKMTFLFEKTGADKKDDKAGMKKAGKKMPMAMKPKAKK